MENMGWQCPSCGECYAPWVIQCPLCTSQVGVLTNGPLKARAERVLGPLKDDFGAPCGEADCDGTICAAALLIRELVAMVEEQDKRIYNLMLHGEGLQNDLEALAERWEARNNYCARCGPGAEQDCAAELRAVMEGQP